MVRDPLLFDGVDELRQTQEQLSEVYRADIFAHEEEQDEWTQLHYRDSLWDEVGGAVGDISASDKHYNVIQFGEIVDATAAAIEGYDTGLEPKGYLQVSDSGHKMTGYINFDGVAAEPVAGDTIDLGLKLRAGHTGMQGITYDVGAQRQVCSNGMHAFVPEMNYRQTHREPLNYALPQHAVAGILEGVDVVEDRLQQASERTFTDRDEALLVLMDVGIDAYFDDPVEVLGDSLDVEMDTATSEVTLYDTYNAATRALTHEAEIETEQRDYALDRAAGLLDSRGELPDATVLGANAVEQRVDEYASDPDTEPYWDGEEETLHTLLDAHGAGGRS